MSRLVRLQAGRLQATVEPERGGVVCSLRSGEVEILYRAPWRPRSPEGPARREREWVEAWQGGWNALFPSAGVASTESGRKHPFHGDASMLPWRVRTAEATAVTVAYADRDGLALERTITLAADALVIASRVENASSVPQAFVLVEHLILGEAVLGHATTIDLDAAPLVPLSDDGPPLQPPARCSPWPLVDRGSGVEDWSTRPAPPGARYGVVPRPAAGVRLAAPDAGIDLGLTWSSTLPYLWVWEEAEAATVPPWNGRVRCLGLEPSTCETGEGLARAVERGDAVVLPPGARWDAEVRVAVERRQNTRQRSQTS